jgi:hypothetical protein
MKPGFQTDLSYLVIPLYLLLHEETEIPNLHALISCSDIVSLITYNQIKDGENEAVVSGHLLPIQKQLSSFCNNIHFVFHHHKYFESPCEWRMTCQRNNELRALHANWGAGQGLRS